MYSALCVFLLATLMQFQGVHLSADYEWVTKGTCPGVTVDMCRKWALRDGKRFYVYPGVRSKLVVGGCYHSSYIDAYFFNADIKRGRDCNRFFKCLCPKVADVYGAFGPFGKCSAECGGGVQERSRVCGGDNCVGPAKETISCNVESCPVDGGFGAFGDFSACSATCGGGTQERSRACDSPAPDHGGADCDGPDIEARHCSTDACPEEEEPIKEEEPTEPTEDQEPIKEEEPVAACPEGSTRDAGGECKKVAQSFKSEVMISQEYSPDLNNRESPGFKHLARKVESGLLQKIKNDIASIDKVEVTGFKQGSIIAEYTVYVLDPSADKIALDDFKSVVQSVQASGSIGDLSVDKTYTPIVEAGVSPAPLPVNGGYGAYGDFSACSEKCGGGTQERSRACDSPAPDHGGADCVGPATESRSCNKKACPAPVCNVDGKVYKRGQRYIDTAMCARCRCKGGCLPLCGLRDIACGAGEKKVDTKEPVPGAPGCSCNIPKCVKVPVDGGYGAFGRYGKCSKKCGGGVQKRSRSCDSPAPAHGGAACVGPSTQSRPCNKKPCKKPSGCRDRNAGCPKWAKSGECGKNPAWMGLNCQKSCNLCGCKDKERGCESWATKKKECGKNPAWMGRNCPLSCGVCGCKDHNAGCLGWSRNGQCKQNKKWMGENCPLSCGTCGARAPAPARVAPATRRRTGGAKKVASGGCRDIWGNCDSQKQYCGNSKDVKDNCCATCKKAAKAAAEAPEADCAGDEWSNCADMVARGGCTKSAQVKKVCCKSCKGVKAIKEVDFVGKPTRIGDFMACPRSKKGYGLYRDANKITGGAKGFKDVCLNAGNWYRKRHIGANKLQWDDDLARESQKYAEDLASRRAEGNDHDPRNDEMNWGESIYKTDVKGESNENLCVLAHKDWYSEIFLYDFNQGGSNTGYAFGHFTAMVWTGTTKVGYGIAKLDDSDYYVVVKYKAGGNKQGLYTSNVERRKASFNDECIEQYSWNDYHKHGII